MTKSTFKILVVTLVLSGARPGMAVVLQGDAAQSLGLFGRSACEVADLNADGRGEFLVGAPQVDLTGTDDGRACLWYGGTRLTAAPSLVLSGQVNEQFGFCVAQVGDVNDDGRPDFAIGAPRYSGTGLDRGRVYLYFGGPALDATPDAILECPDATSGPQFGFAVAAAGDFNGDGIADFLVGAPYEDTAGIDAGSAYIFYGSANLTQLVTPDLTLRGALAYDHCGWSVAGVGNFFHDGVQSVAVGAPANDDASVREGTVLVCRGGIPAVPPDAVPDLTLTSSSGAAHARNWFGYAVRGLGDWNHDGADDLAVGAPRDDTRGLDAGRVEVFLGGASPSTVAARYADGGTSADLFGWALGAPGDVTGDGKADLLIGAPGVRGPDAGSGQAYIFAGGGASADSPAGLYRTLMAAGVAPGSLANDAFGTWVTGAGDLDGDGLPDYAVSAPTGNVAGNAEAGYVRVYDSSGTVVPALLLAWDASWTADGAALLTFSLAEPPAAFTRLALWRRTTPPGGGPAERVLACAGALADGGLPLSFDQGRWLLRDRPAAPAAGATLGYALVLTRSAGDEVALDELAGPPPAGVATLDLQAPRPNPFNPRTEIAFRAPSGRRVACRVFDLRGRLVAVLFDGAATGWWQTATWDGRAGRAPAPSGVYAVRLTAPDGVRTRLALLAR